MQSGWTSLVLVLQRALLNSRRTRCPASAVTSSSNIITWLDSGVGVLYNRNPDPWSWELCYSTMARHNEKNTGVENLCISMNFDFFFLFSCIHSSCLAKKKYFHKNIIVFQLREFSVIWEVCLLDENYYSLYLFVSRVPADRSTRRWVYTGLLGGRKTGREENALPVSTLTPVTTTWLAEGTCEWLL